jgi:hypothetical protein
MMQNLTLSADAEILSRMRSYAKEHNTTVNQIVRDHFEQLVKQQQELENKKRQTIADEFLSFASQHAGRSEKGWKFNREEAHKRGRDLG